MEEEKVNLMLYSKFEIALNVC